MVNPHAVSALSAALVEQIKTIVSQTRNLEELVRDYESDAIILQEGGSNESLFVVLDGTIELMKGSPGIVVDQLQVGSLLGLLSYSTGDRVFTTAVARSHVRLFQLRQADYDQLGEVHPELKRLLDSLTISNLGSRYRRSVSLNIERARLTAELQQERNRLREAILQIEQSRTALISHEKMATLGQLVAGVAHELNNPASSLQHSIERLLEELPRFAAASRNDELSQRLLRAGMELAPSPGQQRIRELEERYPDAGRPLLRQFATLPSPVQQELEELLARREHTRLLSVMEAHQIGAWLRSVSLSSHRIGKLVRSLKNYSRQDNDPVEEIDLGGGIQDTLLILNNRLRPHRVEVNLADMPPVRCRSGAVNQIWTNLIVNATEAMREPGCLGITSRFDTEANEVCISISDSGPGVRPAIRERIFEMNFTTKTGKTGFGLGLGLAISREIVQEYGGRIEVHDNVPRGTRFDVYLPAGEETG